MERVLSAIVVGGFVVDELFFEIEPVEQSAGGIVAVWATFFAHLLANLGDHVPNASA